MCPKHPTKKDTDEDVQRKAIEKWNCTTNMHMITWVLVRVRKEGKNKSEKREGRFKERQTLEY